MTGITTKKREMYYKDFQNVSVIWILKEAGNPFLEESLDLIVFEARDIVDTKAIETLSTVKRIFKGHYRKFLRTNKKNI